MVKNRPGARIEHGLHLYGLWAKNGCNLLKVLKRRRRRERKERRRKERGGGGGQNMKIKKSKTRRRRRKRRKGEVTSFADPWSI